MVVTFFGSEFTVEKFSGIDGKMTYSFTEKSDAKIPFVAYAKPSGMTFSGTLSKEISNDAELSEFARFIADVWKAHLKLAPKIQTSLAGH